MMAEPSESSSDEEFYDAAEGVQKVLYGTDSTQIGFKTPLEIPTKDKFGRLTYLRDRMVVDTDEPEPMGLSSVDTAELSQGGDKMSISSWGRRYLNLPENRNISHVIAFDTNSTKGAIGSNVAVRSFSDPPGLNSSSLSTLIAAGTPNKSLDDPSCDQTTSDLKLRSSSLTEGSKSGQHSSEENPSSGSSKSNTLDRFVSPPDSKSGSLERGMKVVLSNSVRSNISSSAGNVSNYSSAGSRSNSLNREMSNLAVCEQFLVDQEAIACLGRKNSAAAEIVEALTNELVAGNSTKRFPRGVSEIAQAAAGLVNKGFGSRSISSGSESLSTSALSNNQAAFNSCPSCLNNTSTSRCSDNLAGDNAQPVGSAVESGTQVPPDIIVSNTVKSPEEISVPVPPPRRKKLSQQQAASVEEAEQSKNDLDVHIDQKQPSLPRSRSKKLIQRSATKDSTSSATEDLPETSASLPHLDESLKECSDPLTKHIMTITKGYGANDQESLDSDDDSVTSDMTSVSKLSGATTRAVSLAKRKSIHYKRLIGRTVQKTVSKLKHVAEEASGHWRKEDDLFASDDDENPEAKNLIRIRASHHNKGPYEYDQLKLVQELSSASPGSAVWCVKFSYCGRLLATAGQDKLIRVWVLKSSYGYFNDMRQRYNSGVTANNQVPGDFARELNFMSNIASPQKEAGTPDDSSLETSSQHSQDDIWAPFVPKAFGSYRGHTADILDLCWSKNFFLLSSSMDRTVRLWHLSRNECLCCFQHIDFVTSIAFLPKDDRYFLSGSLDGKLRLWNIPEKRVALWNEVDGGKLVTAMTFVSNGKYVVVGTFDGRCIFYTTEQLKYFTQIDVKSTRGKNARGHKVTGLEATTDRLLVTSNDSRVRLYDLRDLSLSCKFKGYTNYSSQIKASFSHDGKHIICGSEDRCIYMWRTVIDAGPLSVRSRKDRNNLWESVRAHNAVVTAAVFAPKPEVIFQQIENQRGLLAADSKKSLQHSMSANNLLTNEPTPAGVDHSDKVSLCVNPTEMEKRSHSRKRSDGRSSDHSILGGIVGGEVVVSADFTGVIYVFVKKDKVKTERGTFLPTYT